MSHFVLALMLATLAAPAAAHVTLESAEAPAGSTYKAVLRIPHGCAGEATHTVRVTLPDGFYDARPMPKAGWSLSTVSGPYATPFDNHGTRMTEGTREVTWSGGDLQDGWYDEFTIRGSLGGDLAPGTVLEFPTVQECANGSEQWTGAEGAGAVPVLTIAAAAAGHGHHTAPESWTLGTLTITGAYSRATLPNAPVGGGFLTITNSGTEVDVLLSASSPAAGHIEVHEMKMEGEVMKMRELQDGLPIPAGATVELKPGGFHMMFMDLTGPLAEGQTVPVTLTFAKAGTIEIPFAVRAPNARGAGEHAGHGMGHGMGQGN